MQNFLVRMDYVCEIKAKNLESALKKANNKNLGKDFDIKNKKIIEYSKNDIVKIAEYSSKEIFNSLSGENPYEEYNVKDKIYKVKINIKDLIFKENPYCVVCGLYGSKIILEESLSKNSCHFNLYGEEDGELILMTKDHIRPRKFGGGNNFSNFQVMCSICNQLKGSSFIRLENLKLLREFYIKNKNNLDFKLNLYDKRRKIEENYLFSFTYSKYGFCLNTDIKVWRMPEGCLVAYPFNKNIKNAVHIASLAKKSHLNVIKDNLFLINEKEECYLNKNLYNEVLEEKKETFKENV